MKVNKNNDQTTIKEINFKSKNNKLNKKNKI